MAIIKPKKPTPPKKKKLGEWKKAYDKKKAKPKPLPQGPSKKKGSGFGGPQWQKALENAKKKDKAKGKGKTPNWRDSTYQKQESYLKKLLADFNAKQIRSKADLAVYYGNEERAAQDAVYEKDTVTKTEIKEKAKAAAKKTGSVNDSIDAMNKNKKKKSPTPPRSGGIPMRRPAPEPKPKPKPKLRENVVTSKKPKLKQNVSTKTVTKGQPKYKTTVIKGKLLRAGSAATKASEGLYHKELAEARDKDKVDIADDYAARGMIRSGLYAQKQGDYEKEYGKQVAETNRQKASRYAELDEENRSFLNNQELEREQARLEAVRRRAAASVGKVK